MDTVADSVSEAEAETLKDKVLNDMVSDRLTEVEAETLSDTLVNV